MIPHKKTTLYTGIFLSVFVFLCGCNPPVTVKNIGIGHEYPGAGSLPLDSWALTDGLRYFLRSFNDTLTAKESKFIWESRFKSHFTPDVSSAIPRVENLPVLLSIINDYDINAYYLKNETFESIYALNSLPLILCVLAIHFDPDSLNPVDPRILEDNNLNSLSNYSERIQMHIVDTIAFYESFYKIKTKDGFILEGLPNDRFNAHLFTTKSDSYIQAVLHFFLTRLPEKEIVECLEDHFTILPYKFKRPEIDDFP